MENGYSWPIAVIFTIGETAGSGLVALPFAMIPLGIIGGAIILTLMCFFTFYTASLLGNNWLIMKTTWSGDYNNHCRNPYPEMAEKAYGRKMALFTNFCTYVAIFGGCAAFCLLAAKTFSEIVSGFGAEVSMCFMLLIIGVFLWPFIMLKSPMHFWQVSIIAMVSTLTAVLLIIIGYSFDASTCSKHSSFSSFDQSSASSSLATIIFAFGGHPCLPTIVHDMRRPHDFLKTFSISYLVLLLIYAPISLMGFSIYGNSVTDSVLSSIQTGFLRTPISILVAIHVFFSILIIANPLLQASEELFNVKHDLGFGRFIVRSIVFFTILISASSVPNFGIAVNLVGGSTLPILVLILPPILAIGLETRQKLKKEGRKDELSLRIIFQYHSKCRLILDFLVIILGVYVIIFSTYQSINAIFLSPIPSARPCFYEWFNVAISTSQSSSSSLGFYNCCGEFRNISRFSEIQCL